MLRRSLPFFGLLALAVPVSETRYAVIAEDNGFAVVNSRCSVVARSDSLPALSQLSGIAVAKRAGGGYRIRVNGRQVARVAGPEQPSLAFSLDGATLAVAGARGVTLVTPKAASPLRLPAGSYSNPAFSPDGSQLALVRTTGNGRANTLRAALGVAPVDGGGFRAVYRVDDPYSFRPRPIFVEGGRRIAFLLRDARVATVAAEGGAVTPVGTAQNGVTLTNLVLAPGGYLVARTPHYGVADIWRVDASGRMTRLTTTPRPPAASPKYGTIPLALSPDATTIFAASVGYLAELPLAGGKPKRLCRAPGPVLGGAWLS